MSVHVLASHGVPPTGPRCPLPMATHWPLLCLCPDCPFQPPPPPPILEHPLQVSPCLPRSTQAPCSISPELCFQAFLTTLIGPCWLLFESLGFSPLAQQTLDSSPPQPSSPGDPPPPPPDDAGSNAVETSTWPHFRAPWPGPCSRHSVDAEDISVQGAPGMRG